MPRVCSRTSGRLSVRCVNMSVRLVCNDPQPVRSQVNISAKASAEVRLRTAVRASASEYDLVVRSLKQEHKGALQVVRRACGAVQLTHKSAKQGIREALTLFQGDFAMLCSKLNAAFSKTCADAGEATRARDELAGRYMQLHTATAQLEEGYLQKLNGLTLQLQQADADKCALQVDNATLFAKLAATTRDLSSLQERAKHQSSQYASDLADARVELAALTQEAARLRQEASSMGDRHAACSAELDAVKACLSSAQQEGIELSKESRAAHARAAAAQREVQAWRAQCKALEEVMLAVGIDMPRMMDDARSGIQRAMLCMRGRPGAGDAPPTPGRLPPTPLPPANSGDEEEDSRARKRSRQADKEELDALLADSRAQLDAALATSSAKAKEREERGTTGTGHQPTAPQSHLAVVAWRKAVATAVPVLRAALA